MISRVTPPESQEGSAISRASLIEQLLSADSRYAEIQAEPSNSCVSDEGECSETESLPSGPESELTFLDDETDFCPRVHPTDRSKKQGSVLQTCLMRIAPMRKTRTLLFF